MNVTWPGFTAQMGRIAWATGSQPCGQSPARARIQFDVEQRFTPPLHASGGPDVSPPAIGEGVPLGAGPLTPDAPTHLLP